MSNVSVGYWDIESVVINSQTIVNYEGFERLAMTRNRLAVLPAGLDFAVESVDGNNLVLVSRGQLFQAKLRQHRKRLVLSLTRPKFTETIVIQARARNADASGTVEREVVQV